MTSEKRSKINKLLRQWPIGTIATQSWLEKQGIYQQLAYGYVQTGWLKRMGHGAYRRTDDRVDWTGGIYALQNHLKMPVYVGAKTALEIQGYGHFIPLGGGGPIYLFGIPGQRLPAWFLQYDWKRNVIYTMSKLFGDKRDLGLTKQLYGYYGIQISSPERAILEALHLIPMKQGFEEATLILEGLHTLRPQLVQSLLECCGSIKVKRLFLFLAEHFSLPCVKELNIKRVNLGKGKRVVVQGGGLDPKYQITVPKAMLQPYDVNAP